MDVDKPGDDGVAGQIDHGPVSAAGPLRQHILNHAITDRERATGDDLIGQYEVGAGEKDHAPGPPSRGLCAMGCLPAREAARAAPITTASLPSVDRTRWTSSDCCGWSRRVHSI